LPEISNDILDDGEKWEIECKILSGDENFKTTLSNIVKKLAPDELIKQINI
jgi:hypothetical protein